MASSLTCATPNPATVSITQTVNANPTANIPGSPGTLCGSASVPFAISAAIAAGSGTVSSIQWRLGGSNIGGATAADYVTGTAGNYDVVVTNSNGCSVTSNTFVLNPAATTLMSGIYTIGAVTATGASSVGTTVTVASTANLVVGSVLTKVSGTGTFAANTVITGIVNGTTFTVNTAPTLALSAAAIAGTTCTNYISFANAIADLNTRSINAGCTFNVTPGYVENLSVKMAALGNAILNLAVATRSIIFQKNGAGTNPKIIAYTGGIGTPASAAPDGIFTISGTDNVTIDGIDLAENGSNSGNALMEYGYGLFKLAAGDGVQNTTIKNCVITLDRTNNAGGSLPMVEGSVGILLINSTATAATTILTPTNGGTINTNGSNSTNKFYTNTIQNCNYGIVLSGYLPVAGFGPTPTATTFLGDLSNDIGGALLANGNTILNFGSAGTNAAAGIRALNQWSVNISYNTLNSNNGSGTNHAGNLRGIFGEAGTSANATINNNTITLKTAAIASTWTGIENVIGSTAAANTVNINNNTIQNCSFSAATSPVFFGISNTSNAATVNINANTVNSISILNTSSPGATLINNTGTVATTALSISSNTISSITNAAASGTIRGISVGTTTSGTFSTNTIDGISYTAVASTGSIDAIISTGGGLTHNYNGNIIRNLSVPTTGTINGIRENGGTTSATKTIQNNQIYNFSTTVGGAGGATFNGILANVGTTVAISGNLINALNSTGTTGGIAGIIAGIQTTSGSTVTISKNKIYNLSTTSTGPFVYGLLMTGTLTQTVTASNNFISDLKAPAANVADAIRGIGVTSATANTTYNVYYNSVYLNAASSGATFGTSGIYHAANATTTTASLNLRNNIIYNISTKSGAGLTVAFRRSIAALNNYTGFVGAASNNNLYYAGTPSASTLIYYDGTNSDQTLATFKTRVSTMDAASVSDVVNFTSTTDLHLAADNNCILEGKAGVIAGFTDDIDLQLRSGSTPDIGADEFTGTNPVSLTITNPAAVCASASTDLTLPAVTAGSSGGTQFYYYTDASGITTLATPSNVTPASTTTYYIKYGKGSCYSAVTPVVVTVNPTNTWLGVNTNWFATVNWCPAVVPGSASDITIPGALSNYPIISSGTAQVRNITIAAGASLTINGTGIIDVKGNLANSGTLTNDGEISMTGNIAQTMPGAGNIVAMKKLTIANTSGLNPAVTINKDLQIADVITPAQGIINLNNVYITLRSKVDSTARIGVVGGSFTYTGTGNFVVERYFPGRRAWRLITAPVVKPASSSIFNSWQAGGNNSILSNATYVTGPSANLATNGLDVSLQNNYSLKKFNHLTSGFDGIANTRTTGLPAFPAGNTATYNIDTSGYFIFVRGDRTPSNPVPFDPYTIGNSTVLRDTGSVKIGNFVYNCNPSVTSPLNYTLIGNPYASPINFTSLIRFNLANRFTVWDPTLSTTGAYVVWDGGTGLFTPNTGVQTTIIQSKQAFFVETNGVAPTLTFAEANKSSINNSLLFRPVPLPSASLNVNLYFKKADGTNQPADGVLAQFNDEYSNESDYLDAVKFTNINETFSIKNGANYFIQDRRPFINPNDTLFFNFARTRQRKYSFNVTIDNIMKQKNRIAYLEDKYLHTATPLNMQGSAWIDFEVTGNAASSVADRFFLTFKKAARFNGINADVVYNDVSVNWSVENAAVINLYEVERSSDGKVFEKVGEVNANQNGDILNEYNLTDPGLEAGYYYYRVKAVSSSHGAYDYSDVVKVKVLKSRAGLYVYPNPVIDGVIGLKMSAASPEGRYAVRLINELGQAVTLQQFQHIKAASTQLISYPSYIAAGSYRLEVTGPDKNKVLLKIIVQTK